MLLICNLFKVTTYFGNYLLVWRDTWFSDKFGVCTGVTVEIEVDWVAEGFEVDWVAEGLEVDGIAEGLEVDGIAEELEIDWEDEQLEIDWEDEELEDDGPHWILHHSSC